MTDQAIDFGTEFAGLVERGQSEVTRPLGGVDVRLVRVAAAGEGRWDHHADSTETVIVWSGSFDVELRDRTLRLEAGQCCVIAQGQEHRATSRVGAEIILFRKSV